MYFENSLFLLAFLLLPICVLFFFFCLKKFSNIKYAGNLPSYKQRIIFGFFRILVLVFIILGISNPFFELMVKQDKYEKIRIFFLLDVSKSMIYANDLIPNRLEATKNEIIRFYNDIGNGYAVSLIPFAGMPNSFYCPLIYNSSLFLSMVSNCTPSVAPAAGTNLTAVTVAVEDYIKRNKLSGDGVNLIVFLTDGGKEEAAFTDREKLFSIISSLSSSNSKVYCLGVGGKDKIPLINRDEEGNFIDYIKDAEGQISYSQLDEGILQEIASAGKGQYKYFGQSGELFGFLEGIVKNNSVVTDEYFITKKIYLQPYLFALASVLVFLGIMANRSRHGGTQ